MSPSPRRVVTAVTVPPSAGISPKSIGAVSVNVAVGNSSTLMMRVRNWPSRRLSPLSMEAMSTVNPPSLTTVPAIVSEPMTEVVRPLAILSSPLMTSLTR